MYCTIDSFADRVTALPEVEDGSVDCSSFPRLAKLATGGGRVSEAKLRSLAARFGVELPPAATDLSDAVKAKWVWGLATLAQSITVRATGWLKLATTQVEFDACVVELSDDGRFTAEWMVERRRQRTEVAELERARRELGIGFGPALTALSVWEHVSAAVRATGAPVDSSSAHNAARALRKYHPLELDGGDPDVMKMAAGTAVLAAMKRKGHGTDRIGAAPAGTAEALQCIVAYVEPTTPFTFDGGEPTGGAASAASAASARCGVDGGAPCGGRTAGDGRDGT